MPTKRGIVKSMQVTCRDKLDLPVTDKDLDDRFYYCGGLPRYIFDDRKDLKALETIMSSAAARAPDWKAIIRHAAGDADKNPDISDSLLHFKLPEDSYCTRVTSKTLIFGSEYVEKLVCEGYQARGFESAKDFFDFCQEIPLAQGLAGKCFEKHAHGRLRSGGGAFRIKALHGPSYPSPIELRPLHVKRLRRWEIRSDIPSNVRGTSSGRRKKNLVKKAGFFVYSDSTSKQDASKAGTQESDGLEKLPPACFVEPYSAIQKAYDSLLTPDIIFQVTTSTEHTLFWSAIWEVVQAYDIWHTVRGLPVPNFYKLIFLVPESKFDEYNFQEYKKDDGSRYEVTMSGMLRVRQFAVAIPWNS